MEPEPPHTASASRATAGSSAAAACATGGCTAPPACCSSGATATARPIAVVLQHRAEWSHHGGTWGIPGGARMPDEDAATLRCGRRRRRPGIDPVGRAASAASASCSHPDWSYTTVLADEIGPVHPTVTDAESLELRWVQVDEVAALPLLPAFADAWPSLRERLDQ